VFYHLKIRARFPKGLALIFSIAGNSPASVRRAAILPHVEGQKQPPPYPNFFFAAPTVRLSVSCAIASVRG
jgi:hypothetical protein